MLKNKQVSLSWEEEYLIYLIDNWNLLDINRQIFNIQTQIDSVKWDVDYIIEMSMIRKERLLLLLKFAEEVKNIIILNIKEND